MIHSYHQAHDLILLDPWWEARGRGGVWSINGFELLFDAARSPFHDWHLTTVTDVETLDNPREGVKKQIRKKNLQTGEVLPNSVNNNNNNNDNNNAAKKVWPPPAKWFPPIRKLFSGLKNSANGGRGDPFTDGFCKKVFDTLTITEVTVYWYWKS